jgi:hypothetical protein
MKRGGTEKRLRRKKAPQKKGSAEKRLRRKKAPQKKGSAEKRLRRKKAPPFFCLTEICVPCHIYRSIKSSP